MKESVEEKDKKMDDSNKPKDTSVEKTENLEESKNEEKKEKKEEKAKEEKVKKDEVPKFEKAKKKAKKLEKEIKKMDNKKSKKKYIIIGGIAAFIIIIVIFISTIFALVNINNSNMMAGVSIEGVEVSGLSKEEAKAKMETIYQEKKEKEIPIKYEEYETTLNPTLMEVNYNIEKAVDEAYSIGRNENIFLSNYEILFSLIAKQNVNVEMTLNEDATKQMIEDIGVNLPGIVIESSYAIEGEELIITKGKAGILIDTDNLLNQVKERLKQIDINEDYIEIPFVNKEPEPIDIDKIHEEIYKEAQDAYFTKDPFAIYPEVEGVDFDVEAARALLAEEKEEYVIELIITKPKITIDQLGSEAFPDQLSTFTTRYDVSDVDRTKNLEIACQKINGKVLLSGETFSYNKALGPRTAAAGYRNGKIYSGGEVVDGIGGGICQISSTLYNAVLLADLEIVERRNHQFVTSYVGAGRDATVVYGSTDFQFKNTREYPIKISASAKNGIATISIYGIKQENEYTFKFSTKTVATIPYSTQYVEDSSLAAGTEKVKQKGTNGLKTETYITKMLNGKVISTKLLSRDTYNAMTRIVLKGTGAATTQTPSAPVETPSTTEPSTPVEENTGTTETTDTIHMDEGIEN